MVPRVTGVSVAPGVPPGICQLRGLSVETGVLGLQKGGGRCVAAMEGGRISRLQFSENLSSKGEGVWVAVVFGDDQAQPFVSRGEVRG